MSLIHDIAAATLLGEDGAQAATVLADTSLWTAADDPELEEQTSVTSASGQSVTFDHGYGAYLSNEAASGDFNFTGTVQTTDLDNDIFGIVLGYGDGSNNIRIGWTGGGDFDDELRFTPPGGVGLFLAQEVGGVATRYSRDDTNTWTNGATYDFLISVVGSQVSYSFFDGVTLVGSGSDTVSANTNGFFGVYVGSQSAVFGNLAYDLNPGSVTPPPDPVDPNAPTTGDDVLTGTEDPDTIDGLAGNDQISGLAGNDTLRGGDGNDTIDGGTGKDRMEGGAGDDSYRIDAAGDRIAEAAGNGIDVVRATAQVTLGGAEVETVILEGSANLRVNGNAFATEFTGNDGSNILVSGGGGDTVTGGAGNDFFAFQRSDAAGPVTITDFSAGDKLALDDRFFGLGGADVDPRAVTDQQAASALRSEAFSYNRSTGELFVDLDARGGPLDPILIAVIEGGVSIGQDDVLLF